MLTLHVEIWSDIACPWCYVGKRRFAAALARFEHAESVELVWRAFELDPSAPRSIDPIDLGVSYAQRLARKYATSVQQGEAMIQRMTATAAEEGLDFHFERIRPGNTLDAHRLVHLATTRGLGDAAKERFLRAYLCEGEAIGDPQVLARLAVEVGLDGEEVSALLASDRFEREVRAEEEEARRGGISGVPYFVIGGRHGLSGAQPAPVILQALNESWQALSLEAATTSKSEGASCGTEGCE
jgi:predicted DsbA family dithiol-disulfide isomerase